eukprot:Clim_evm8s191 gene=Clim_evmTU8s191
MDIIGSSYEGDQRGDPASRRLEGTGTYQFPNGTKYVGELKDGQFHGKGTLYFINGAKYEAEWKGGKAVKGTMTFSDGLRYEPQDWDYCSEGQDRRFYDERVDGIAPTGMQILILITSLTLVETDWTEQPC